MRRVTILSGGAAQGLITSAGPAFEAQTGAAIDATYGAVGAMRDMLLGGAPTDLLVLTSPLIDELTRSGHVRPASAADIGAVETAIAVRLDVAPPPIGNGEELRAAMLAADAIYFPDPKLATAGIHFAKVLDRLGVREALEGRLRTFPNGASAMREMAKSRGRSIGCTQATEILATPGVTLVGPLPREFGLATVYTCGIATAAKEPDLAMQLAAMLTSPDTAEVRQKLGFRAVK